MSNEITKSNQALSNVNFLRQEGDVVFVDCYKLEVLISDSFFEDPAIAEDVIGAVNTLMFADIHVYYNEDQTKPRKFALRLPARLNVSYREISNYTDESGEKFKKLTSYESDILFENLVVVQSSDNVSEILRALTSAKISDLEYESLASLFIEGTKLNNAKAGVSRAILEAMVSEMARYKNDTSTPLRILLASGKATSKDYTFIKLKDLPRHNGVFTAIGFEDIQYSVQTSVRKTQTKSKQRLSPLEEVMKY